MAGLQMQIRDVSLVYGRRRPTHAIERLDLDIDEGKFVAVVGPSGCGKSSLMKLVTGLLRPTGGQHRGGWQGGQRPAEDRRHGL